MFAEESVYNLVPPPPVPVQKPAPYTSAHPGNSKPTGSTFGLTSAQTVANLAGSQNNKSVEKQGHATFGKPLCSSMPDPNRYLKAESKTMTLPAPSGTRQPQEKLKPGIPDKKDVPIMNLVSGKNYIVANAVEAILAAPKRVRGEYEDFMGKDDYGKVPAYLTKVKSDIQAEIDYIRDLQAEQYESEQTTRPMSEDERLQILAGLKARWEQVNHDYQAATHKTKLTSVGEIRRKEECETALTKLEKDIEKMRRANIMVEATM